VLVRLPEPVPGQARELADSLERLLEGQCSQERKTRVAVPAVAELHSVQKNGPVEQAAAASAPVVADVDVDVSMAVDTSAT
jgi:hypothetical protein